MDATTLRLIDLARSSRYDRIPAETVNECKRRLVDTIACALHGFETDVGRAARTLARRTQGTPSASVWRCGWTTTVEWAAFANGSMFRYLDWSDMYGAKGGGHPSDVISGIVAAAESQNASGRDLIAAITLAYDVWCTFVEAVDISERGFDQPVQVAIASALAIGRLVRLTDVQLGHALALALAPNIALYQTRRGELSSWKGCAAANGARNALFAVALAREGFTGPSEVFDGKDGLRDVVGAFDWELDAGERSPHRVTLTHMKSFPICYHGQSAVSAALQLRDQVRPDDVASITIRTHHVAINRMADDPTRWAPRSHETADHSLPYTVAVALTDGHLSAGSFSAQRLVDPLLGALMSKVRVEEDPDYSAQYPAQSPATVTITQYGGRQVTAEVRQPKGHLANPFTDDEIGQKYRDGFAASGSSNGCNVSLAALWSIDEAPDVAGVLAGLVEPSRDDSSAPIAAHST